MFPEPPILPLSLTYSDAASPFALEATVTAWHPSPEPGREGTVVLTLGTGTLHDADKGRFVVDDAVMTLCVTAGGFEPITLLTPGALSEFQQAGLLDAVASALTTHSDITGSTR